MRAELDVVFARHREPLNWAGYLSRLPGVRVFVHNDGDPMEMEDEVAFKGFRISAGDGRPAESGKYLRHILDHYDGKDGDGLAEFTVFSQADPFEHSPDFIGLLGRRDLWEPVQNLTYRYTRGWGPHRELADESDEISQKFLGGFRLWEQRMDADLQGLHWKDPFCERMKFALCDEEATILTQISRKFGFRPAEETLRKNSGACFAVRRDQILKHPKKLYEDLLQWYLSPYESDDILAVGFTSSITKARAILLEFLWLAIFDADPIFDDAPRPPRPRPHPADGPMARLRRRVAYASPAPSSSSFSDTKLTSLSSSSLLLPDPSSSSSSLSEPSSVSLSMKLPMLLPESSSSAESEFESPPDSNAESSSPV